MTSTVMHGDKMIIYDENFWTGKKTIRIDGKTLQKLGKKTYKFGDKSYTVKGSYITGVEMTDGFETITLVRKLTALETVLCFLPFVLIVTGGALGGACGGAACAFNAMQMRKNESTVSKILCAILSTVVAFVCYLIVAIPFTLLFMP